MCRLCISGRITEIIVFCLRINFTPFYTLHTEDQYMHTGKAKKSTKSMKTKSQDPEGICVTISILKVKMLHQQLFCLLRFLLRRVVLRFVWGEECKQLWRRYCQKCWTHTIIHNRNHSPFQVHYTPISGVETHICSSIYQRLLLEEGQNLIKNSPRRQWTLL